MTEPRRCGMSWLADIVEAAIVGEMQKTGETREAVVARLFKTLKDAKSVPAP